MTLDTKALEAAEAAYFTGFIAPDDRLKAAIEAYLSATPSRNDILEEAARAVKYDMVLTPFVAMMERELHANSGKGDRPGWLSMSREEVLLEIYYHLAKLQKAVRTDDAATIQEFAADVANMSMMAVDICGAWPADAAIRALVKP